jgi:hypothetical protein
MSAWLTSVLNDLAKRGIVKRGERKGTYALQASVSGYCQHLREQAAGRGGGCCPSRLTTVRPTPTSPA